jgi:hypothetical protein
MGIIYEMMNYLRKWLIDHIKGADKLYASSFKRSWV